jgi:hypothetical protein
MPKIIKPEIDKFGNNYWVNKKGVFHRVDGPAWIGSGIKEWCLNGKLHREDGPAYEGTNGYKEWYLNGYLYEFQDYLKELKKIGKSDGDIMLLCLKYK